jgi:hypothetical protein
MGGGDAVKSSMARKKGDLLHPVTMVLAVLYWPAQAAGRGAGNIFQFRGVRVPVILPAR